MKFGAVIKKKFLITPYKFLHEKILFSGRCNALVANLANFFPDDEINTILDVGCGDGRIAQAIHERKPNLQFLGLEVMARETCSIKHTLYDGHHLPFEDKSFDYVMFVDVLHHTHNIEQLLSEANRVAKKGIVIKDHNANNILDYWLLAIADWVGNWPYGVHLPYNFKSPQEWGTIFEKLNIQPAQKQTKFKLHPFLLRTIFGSRLHFIVRLTPADVPPVPCALSSCKEIQ